MLTAEYYFFFHLSSSDYNGSRGGSSTLFDLAPNNFRHRKGNPMIRGPLLGERI